MDFRRIFKIRKDDYETARIVGKMITNAMSLEVRSIDNKLINTEKMFQLIEDRMARIEVMIAALAQTENQELVPAASSNIVGPRDYDLSSHREWSLSFAKVLEGTD